MALALLILSLAAVGAQNDALPSPRYGDELLRSVMVRHPQITGVVIEAAGKNGPIAIRRGMIARHRHSRPLRNSLGDVIGTVTIASPGWRTDADRVATEIGRRVYSLDGLLDPDTFVAGARRRPRAQALVDSVIDSNARLVTLAMHVAPPGESNMIIASNFGRIGKPADGDDDRVLNDGAVIRETTNQGRRLAVELPQLDANGQTIGALSTSFTLTPEYGVERAFADAGALRDRIARQTPTLATLTAP